MERDVIVRVEQVKKSYRTEAGVIPALNGASLMIYEGELVALAGDSGSGKSTLLRLLGALDKPDSGKVTVHKQEISRMDEDQRTLFRRNNIGFVFEEGNLVQTLDARENIMLPLQLAGKEANVQLMDSLLEKLILPERKYLPASQITPAEQQKVAVLRAMMQHPELILADEPTGRLDSDNTLQLLKIIRFLSRRMKRTTILATDSMQVARMCDRMLILKDGIVLQEAHNETA